MKNLLYWLAAAGVIYVLSQVIAGTGKSYKRKIWGYILLAADILIAGKIIFVIHTTMKWPEWHVLAALVILLEAVTVTLLAVGFFDCGLNCKLIWEGRSMLSEEKRIWMYRRLKGINPCIRYMYFMGKDALLFALYIITIVAFVLDIMETKPNRGFLCALNLYVFATLCYEQYDKAGRRWSMLRWIGKRGCG